MNEPRIYFWLGWTDLFLFLFLFLPPIFMKAGIHMLIWQSAKKRKVEKRGEDSVWCKNRTKTAAAVCCFHFCSWYWIFVSRRNCEVVKIWRKKVIIMIEEEIIQAKKSYWYLDFIKQKISSVQSILFEKLNPGKNSLYFNPFIIL